MIKKNRKIFLLCIIILTFLVLLIKNVSNSKITIISNTQQDAYNTSINFGQKLASYVIDDYNEFEKGSREKVAQESVSMLAETNKIINGIKVTTLPTKTSYIQNYENLDLTGGELTATYSDGSTDKISLANENVTVTGFDNSQIGTVTLTIEYEGYKTTFGVEIISNVNQEAIQEVADAFYNKSTYAQYCNYRLSYMHAPEEATSQHTIYNDCSDFTFSVYYQAFGIQIPNITARIVAYGQKYYDADNIITNDVIEYWEQTTDDDGNKVFYDNNGNKKDIDLSTASGRAEYAKVLLTEYNLQIGDVICYRAGAGGALGHAVMVYGIIYDSDGNPTDAIIRESTSNREYKTTKITNGLSYLAKENESTGVTEGTFREFRLSSALKISDTSSRNSLIYDIRNAPYVTILRPLLRNESGNYTGKYYYASCSSDSSATFGYTYTERTLTDYKITDSTVSRIKYSKIDIDKTVNVFNNSVVELGDTIYYTIKVTNNSESTYGSFDIVENISEYVDIVDSANGTVNDGKITWTISGLEAGKTKEIKYSVKVKNDINILEKQINSTGTVAGIPSATVNNIISSNLNSDEIKEIVTKTEDTISTNQTGEDFISEIYKNALNMDLSLEDFDITNLVISRAGIAYYPDGSSNKPTVYINKDDGFYSMVLKDYWGALYTSGSGAIYLKHWENSLYKTQGRSERETNIYKENFQTGDVLVYQNTQTASDSVTYETEDGTYYLIYISDEDAITVDGTNYSGFIGLDDSGNIKNISTEFTDLRTLLGKDYYVVLRPTMAYATERGKQISKIEVSTPLTKTNYIQNYEKLDLTGGILTVTYNDETTDTISLTNENITVTGFDNSKIGKIELQVNYNGFSTVMEVEIINNNTNTTNNNTNTNSVVENTTNTTINDTNSVSQNTADQDSKSNENTNIATGTVAVTKNTSSNNQNTNSLNSIKADNSTSSNSLPNTGTEKIRVLAFIVIGISGVYAFIKYRKVKEVK